MYYTIGQRKGLNIGGDSRFKQAPWFVIGKDLENNVLIAGQGRNHPLLYANRILVENVNWISGKRPEETLECTAKFRYRQPDNLVRVRFLSEDTVEVITNKPVWAITPGQAAVFYQGEICLGGGTIDKVYQNQKLMMY
jgi:tRNA-specific 2-thiouridylase